MPLDTVIRAIRHVAHDTQRLDSVQAGETADLWLDAGDCAPFGSGRIDVAQQSWLLSS